MRYSITISTRQFVGGDGVVLATDAGYFIKTSAGLLIKLVQS